MKRNLVLLVVLLLAVMATLVQDVAAQKKCWYYCKPPAPRRVVRTGCNSCARLKVVEERINALENNKPEDRGPQDFPELTTLRKEFEDLVGRVEKLEQEMAQVKTDVGVLRTDLNSLSGSVDSLTVTVNQVGGRVTTLEGECRAILGQDRKLYWACPGQVPIKIKTGGGSTLGNILRLANEGGQWFCLLTGNCQIGGGGRPPTGTTGDSF